MKHGPMQSRPIGTLSRSPYKGDNTTHHIPSRGAISRAKQKGREAFRLGVMITGCPLYSSLKMETAWKEGWEERRQNAKNNNR